jgi:hypothetical protein
VIPFEEVSRENWKRLPWVLFRPCFIENCDPFVDGIRWQRWPLRFIEFASSAIRFHGCVMNFYGLSPLSFHPESTIERDYGDNNKHPAERKLWPFHAVPAVGAISGMPEVHLSEI